ncbi:MAG TPA: phospholipase D-like domain-containing protein [Gemmatimonadales bacterium]|nr:phospholipase D-like domain-containing protein [Gemmatimonadales bacterium]
MSPKRSATKRSRPWSDGWRQLRTARAAVAVLVGLLLAVILLYVNLASSERKVENPLPHRYATADSQFVRTMGSLLGPGFLPGNRVTTLLNGDQVFPAMLQAIRSARRTITFENYIYWSSQVEQQFSQALAERARAGVRVHLLLDWVGSDKKDRNSIEQMRKAGVEVVEYRPLRWYNLDRLNHRDHRKILVVDGRVGFTGGVGIADKWLGHAQDRDHWRDSHFQAEGPVVAQLQSVFMDDWFATRGTLLDGPGYFPDLDPVGPEWAQAFRSSPSGGSESVRLMYLLAIAAAARSILIANAYFVPDRVTVAMLVEARRRGVEVEIIVPGPILDAQVVRRASRELWGPLLRSGVRIYEYQPTMYHTKVMVVDDLWVSVGSTNFDERSFRLNQEANLNVLDPGFAEEQVRVFREDRQRSKRITLEEWRRRPLWERVEGWVAGVGRGQL